VFSELKSPVASIMFRPWVGHWVDMGVTTVEAWQWCNSVAGARTGVFKYRQAINDFVRVFL
jgi:hypothetical protein